MVVPPYRSERSSDFLRLHSFFATQPSRLLPRGACWNEADGASCLRTPDHRGDGGGCHSRLMVLGRGRADGPADLLEVRGEIIDLQDIPRRIEYCLGVVPVHVPTARLGCAGERL